MEQPARNFNLYWGFGEPLEVLDDRALLADMARLKQRANYPDGKTLPQSPRIAPPGVPPPSTKSAPSLRPTRPSTAPTVGRRTPAAMIPLVELPTPLVEARAASPSNSEGQTPGRMTPFARRERYARDQRLKQKRNAANLEKRWEQVDAAAAASRQATADAARERVSVWDGKRQSGQQRLDVSTDKRTALLGESLRVKNDRVDAWRQRQEAEEARKREEHAENRKAAGKRFAQGMRTRESRLQDAQDRVARRAGALAALRRAELAERRRLEEIRHDAALQTRRRVEEDMNERIRQTEEKSRKREKQVEAFLLTKREEHERKVEATHQAAFQAAASDSAPAGSPRLQLAGLAGGRPLSARSTGNTPRGGSSTPRGATPRGRLPAGSTGLEVPWLK